MRLSLRATSRHLCHHPMHTVVTPKAKASGKAALYRSLDFALAPALAPALQEGKALAPTLP